MTNKLQNKALSYCTNVTLVELEGRLWSCQRG